jgi:hypothetical protein
VQHQRNHGDDQQNVNQATRNVEREKSQEPHYEQNNEYRQKHLKSPLYVPDSHPSGSALSIPWRRRTTMQIPG